MVCAAAGAPAGVMLVDAEPVPVRSAPGCPAGGPASLGPVAALTHGVNPLLATTGSNAGLPAVAEEAALPRHCQFAACAEAAPTDRPHAAAHSPASSPRRGV